MFGKQLANPAYPKMDTGVNPISLIKVGLIDPKNGIVAPNEPQLVIEKSPKLTLSEKICYSLVVLLVVGGLVGIITYRILQESSSMPGGMGGYGGGMRGKSLSSSSKVTSDRSLNLGASRLAMLDDSYGDGLRRSAFFSDDSAFDGEQSDEEQPFIESYFSSFALIKIHINSSANGTQHFRYCAGVVKSADSVLTTDSCLQSNDSSQDVIVYTGIDQNSIGMLLNGNVTEQVISTQVISIKKGDEIDAKFSVLTLASALNSTNVRAVKLGESNIFGYGYFVCIKKNMKTSDKPAVYWRPFSNLVRIADSAFKSDILEGLPIYNSEIAGDLTLVGLYKHTSCETD